MTTTVVNFAKVFTSDNYCDILVENIKHYRQKYRFSIIGFVIMPSHFHWIVEVNPELGTISAIMRDIKKFSAWDLMDAFEKDKKFGFLRMFRAEAQGYRDQKRKLSMKRFDDEYIRNDEMLHSKLDYIHNNPVEAGLISAPEDYKYSSARNYVLGDHSVLEVKTDWI
ncbi:MAG: transposase [Ignavibacteriales bacterium]|nr:transposase [Ignavibacteriales bacterium]